jgi:hypothetical protein
MEHVAAPQQLAANDRTYSGIPMSACKHRHDAWVPKGACSDTCSLALHGRMEGLTVPMLGIAIIGIDSSAPMVAVSLGAHDSSRCMARRLRGSGVLEV